MKVLSSISSTTITTSSQQSPSSASPASQSSPSSSTSLNTTSSSQNKSFQEENSNLIVENLNKEEMKNLIIQSLVGFNDDYFNNNSRCVILCALTCFIYDEILNQRWNIRRLNEAIKRIFKDLDFREVLFLTISRKSLKLMQLFNVYFSTSLLYSNLIQFS